MGRHPAPPRTALGAALRQRRGDMSGEEAAGELGVFINTFYRLERGTHRPSTDTALALARWLGWTMEQVIQAADQPAPDKPDQAS